MQNHTRQQFNALTAGICRYYQVENPASKFTVNPERVQWLFDELQESADFLSEINIIPVAAQTGQKLGLGIGSPVASRTNTDEKERETAYVGTLKPDDYFCSQTNFDTHISYRVMDAWAHLTEQKFRRRYVQAFIRRMALDMIMIGFNGEEVAANTDRTTNKLLEDVNIGWFSHVRTAEPGQIMGCDSEGLETGDVFQIGEGGKYQTLDALAFDMKSSLLDSWHQESDDLVLLLGNEIRVKHGLDLYNENRPATERIALETWFTRQAVAGMPTVTPPFLPARSIIITSYDNLSIYRQQGSVRRAVIDNPKRDRVEEYWSANDAYAVEDYGKFAAVLPSAVKLKNDAGEWY